MTRILSVANAAATETAPAVVSARKKKIIFQGLAVIPVQKPPKECKMRITFTDYFHNTTCVVYAKDGELNTKQINKIEKTLCGMSDCSCGLYPIYGVTHDGATASLSKDGDLLVYHEVAVSYNIDLMPYILRSQFANKVDAFASTVNGEYDMREGYRAIIKCPRENYKWMLAALQDSDLSIE